ncbi:MAG: xanthine phosphoribosyltransferase [Clostridiales bacterium]|jgi:xanthine phosphoribosyltransferase|nr:xanthine phosphoribosyltransferase [Clostridiales bacterium]
MKALEDKILAEGEVLTGNVLKVGSFLNQQVDTDFMTLIAKEGARLYKDAGITKVLTLEASGIAVAFAVAQQLHVPMVYAKKYGSSNITNDVYKASVYSYTHKQTFDIVVSKKYLQPDDVILLVDDFLALGNALNGLIHIVEQSGANLAGALIAIEKGFQSGGDLLREEGVRVESLAIIDSMEDGKIVFRELENT